MARMSVRSGKAAWAAPVVFAALLASAFAAPTQTYTAYNPLSDQYAAYLLAVPAIPEPASASLMGLGLAVLWAARRARRSHGGSAVSSTATGATPCT